jgi:hypothetical protein
MRKMYFALAIVAQMAAAQEPDIRKTIDSFFEAFHKKDTVLLGNVVDRSAVFHSVVQRGEKSTLQPESREAFMRGIASIPASVAYEEKLLGYEIHIDGNMAHVWTPYEFYVNGVVVHTGVNSFQLFRSPRGWKIVYCIDTRKKA